MLLIKLLMIIVIACTSLLSVACSPLTLSEPTTREELILSVLSEPKTFNYVLSQESPNIFGYTYESLISQNPITNEYKPALAESWTTSEDKLKLTFKLRKGLKWSDGQPLNADDVLFTYNQLYLNEDIPYNGRDGLRIGQSKAFPKINKINDLEIEFITSEPFAPFLDTIGGSPILPKHLLEPTLKKRDKDGNPVFLTTWGTDTPPEQIIVNGPYKLDSYSTSQRVIFKRNPYYWNKPQPYIEKIIWQIVESTDTSLLQFRSGGLDAISVTPDYFSLLKSGEKRGNFTIYNGGAAYGTSFISFNLNKGKRNGKSLVDPVKSKWFNNVNFRRAIAYSIDRSRMINNIFRGLGTEQNSAISIQSPYYNKEVKSYEYNPTKAREILMSEGFKYDKIHNKLTDSEGNPVKFSLITNAGNRIREAMGTQIKQDLGAIGIQVDYTPIAFNVLVDKLDNSLDWECFLLGFTGGNEPNGGANVWFPDGSLHVFNQAPQAGRNPITGRVVSDWEVEIAQLYIAAAKELDVEKRREIYAKTQNIAQEYLPLIYLVNPLSFSAVRNHFEGIEYSALGGPFWNIDEIKIKQ